MERLVLVLGGGGVKGMAHVGAWKAVQEAGLTASEIIGTSIGGLVGACVAAGQGWRELAPRALSLEKAQIVLLNRWALLLNGIRQPSIFQGETLRQYIEGVLPVGDWEDLQIPLALNAVDLETGKLEWFGAGGRTDVALADAVYATCALPVFYPPAEIGGRFYVDGAVGDSLPIRRARERGADRVLAVDVSAGEMKDPQDTVAKGMIAIHHRTFDIMAFAQRRAQLEAWEGPPLLHVRPKLEGYSTFDFERTAYFLEEGYRATRRALWESGWVDLPARRAVP